MHSAGWRAWIAPLLVVAAVGLTFGRTVGYGFVDGDDNLHITDNAYLNPPSWAGQQRLWATPYFGEYTPVAYAVFGFEVWLSGWWSGLDSSPNPHLFHAVNVALHALVALAVLRLLGKLGAGASAAFLGALVFALHPVQTESVAWVSETRGVLAGGLSILAVLGYLNFRTDRAPSPWRRRFWYLAGWCSFVVAGLTKPTAAAVPLLLAVIDRILLRVSFRRTALATAPWLVTAMMFAWLTKREQTDPSIHQWVAPWLRPLVAGDAFAFYAAKLVWPWPLLADYGRTPQAVFEHGWGYVTWVLPLAMLAAVAWWRQREIATATGWFLAAVAPVLGLVPFGFQDISTVADRYLYLTLVGPAYGVACLVAHSGKRALGVASAVVMIWAAVSWHQAGYWRDTHTLFSRTLEYRPDSFMAHNNLSVAERRSGNIDEAEAHARRAIEMRPYDPNTHINLGAAQFDRGQIEDAGNAFAEAVRLSPNNVTALANLGRVRLEQDRLDEAERAYRELLSQLPGSAVACASLGRVAVKRQDLPAARQWFEQARRFDPRLAESYAGLAVLAGKEGRWDAASELYAAAVMRAPRRLQYHVGLATAAAAQRDWQTAAASYRQAAALAPQRADVWFGLGHAELKGGQADAAVVSLRRAAELAPRESAVFIVLAEARLAAGEPAEAVAALQSALRLDPNAPEVVRRLAWLLATHPDSRIRNGPRAVQLLVPLVAEQPQPAPELLDALGAAYAAAGQFAEAVGTVERALTAARSLGRSELIEGLSARLERYHRGQPFVTDAIPEKPMDGKKPRG